MKQSAQQPRRVYSRTRVAAVLDMTIAEARRLMPSYGADAFTLRGRGGPAWTLEGMPPEIANDLKAVSDYDGRPIEEILDEQPLRHLNADALVRMSVFRYNVAIILRSCLWGALEKHADWPRSSATTWPVADRALVEAVAIEAYRSSPRLDRIHHVDLQALIRRAMRRDLGMQEWGNLSLYVPSSAHGLMDRAAAFLLDSPAAYHYHFCGVLDEVASAINNHPCGWAKHDRALWLASFYDCEAEMVFRHKDVSDKSAKRLFMLFMRSFRSARKVSKHRFRAMWLSHFEHWKAEGRMLPLRTIYAETRRLARK
jgi:hypothetical protein